VYRAHTLDGRDVAVKIQRPGALESLALDLHIVREALGWVSRLAKTTRDLRDLADGLGGQLYAELDYVGEAANAVAFREAHSNLPYLHVPRTVPQLCTPRVLVLEWVRGVPPSQVTSHPALIAHRMRFE
jgi:aarF domain-containing kinase